VIHPSSSCLLLDNGDKNNHQFSRCNKNNCAERVRVTVRVRPPTMLEQQRDEDGAPFIFLDTEKNTVILRRKYVYLSWQLSSKKRMHNQDTAKK
jgi:hypothetical protein